MIKIKVRKLFHNCVSLRDYLVQKALRRKEPVQIILGSESMILYPSQLQNGDKESKTYRSKWNNRRYGLVNYKWEPQPQLKLV